MSDKRILLKSLRLENCFKDYKMESQRSAVYKKFETVWGPFLADHFLTKYSDAESLIWGLDNDNLLLFINKF